MEHYKEEKDTTVNLFTADLVKSNQRNNTTKKE
jgi:hypothetical protein